MHPLLVDPIAIIVTLETVWYATSEVYFDQERWSPITPTLKCFRVMPCTRNNGWNLSANERHLNFLGRNDGACPYKNPNAAVSETACQVLHYVNCDRCRNQNATILVTWIWKPLAKFSAIFLLVQIIIVRTFSAVAASTALFADSCL